MLLSAMPHHPYRAHACAGAHGDAVTAVAFNPLHPQLAVGCLDGRVHFYSDGGTPLVNHQKQGGMVNYVPPSLEEDVGY
jgi:WD40 repeat protein